MTDNQINFEYYCKNESDFDFTKDEDGNYSNKETDKAFRIFCIGVRVGGMG